jgi:hypothetical protein
MATAAETIPTALTVRDGQMRQAPVIAYKRRVTRLKGAKAQPWMAEIMNMKPTVIAAVFKTIVAGSPISSRDGAKIIRNGSM